MFTTKLPKRNDPRPIGLPTDYALTQLGSIPIRLLLGFEHLAVAPPGRSIPPNHPIGRFSPFNADGALDVVDVDMMIDFWGSDDSLCDIGPMPWGDGVVDAQDLLVLARYMVQDAADADDANDL